MLNLHQPMNHAVCCALFCVRPVVLNGDARYQSRVTRLAVLEFKLNEAAYDQIVLPEGLEHKTFKHSPFMSFVDLGSNVPSLPSSSHFFLLQSFPVMPRKAMLSRSRFRPDNGLRHSCGL